MNTEIRVWDILVRLFHWSLVVIFFISYFTGDEEDLIHIYTGYVVLGLIVFRLLWGIIGSKHARFSDFLYSPTSVIKYLKGLMRGKPQHYVGHNPAAGWMVIALLLSLFVTTISGLKVYAVEEGKGPLASVTTEFSIISTANADDDDRYNNDDNEKGGDKNSDEFWEELHEASANFTFLLIFLHVAGVIVASKLHKENLIKAMITGKKKV
ncbi:cytochrome b/b6 domain-containing protein [uncultured Cocleimonas sp.]|uniref:cytochrome b/b6 domain-containing protein n=1 Tax=uncultured Cocleimonas sp. TaxID=1051587 RepID=UPI00262E3D99|nr:cytochrome b/b6 domain-containing protein [uncultured Cocleimonas sp.]